MNKIKIVLADDHKILIDGLRALLEKQSDIFVAGVYDNGLTLYQELHITRPQIALLDINMPGMNGLELTKKICAEHPETRVITLSMYDDATHIMQLINAGAAAYLFKNVNNNELLEAVYAVANGKMYFSPEITGIIAAHEAFENAKNQERKEPSLTKRELELLKLIALEYTNACIADTLFISERTVETHRKNMLRKTNHKNMVGLLKYVMENNLI
jgi:DNA-binding NarL/FixJ family response regulator